MPGRCTSRSTNPGRTLVTLTVAGLAVSLLAGCGGGSSAGKSGASGSSPTASAGATTVAATTAASAAGGSSGKLSFTDAEACAWAKQELVALKTITDPMNVQFNILGSLTNFFDKHGGLQNAARGGFDIDAATARACPDQHALLLKKAKLKSFGDL